MGEPKMADSTAVQRLPELGSRVRPSSRPAPAQLSITQIDTPSREIWSCTWADCSYATFFHGPEWAETWERFTGGKTRPAARRFRFSDGTCAILPLSFEERLAGMLNRYVASPQGTFGGWISADELRIEHALLLTKWLMDDCGSSLVWRLNPYDPLVFTAGIAREIECRPDHTNAIRLSVGIDDIQQKLKNGYRKDIRKATQRGHIRIEPATTIEEWKAYYTVYEDTLRRWGHSLSMGYPWALFQTLFELQSPNITLWLGRYEGEIVSGELCFYSQKQVVSWHAATLEKHLRSHVAKVQIFRILEDSCRRGYAWFDFNPSAGLAGVKTFKESFNAEALPAPMVYVDSPLKRLARAVAAPLGVRDAKVERRPLATVLEELSPALAVTSEPPGNGATNRPGCQSEQFRALSR